MSGIMWIDKGRIWFGFIIILVIVFFGIFFSCFNIGSSSLTTWWCRKDFKEWYQNVLLYRLFCSYLSSVGSLKKCRTSSYKIVILSSLTVLLSDYIRSPQNYYLMEYDHHSKYGIHWYQLRIEQCKSYHRLRCTNILRFLNCYPFTYKNVLIGFREWMFVWFV